MLRVRFMQPAELDLVVQRGTETALAQLVERERPGASRSGVAAQLAQMYRRVLLMTGAAVLVADAEAAGVKDGPAAHVLLMPQPNPFTGEWELVVMDIYTHPAVRGQGVGQAMLQHSRAYARSIGCRSLAAQVALHNQASLALFRSAGFQTERVTVGLRC
ncbi:MAG TPA: GNAT family N-acetyltransferase [Symbiobacteriaceae bacterium]